MGIEHGDDAGVFRLDSSTALIQTIDFLTPIVDTPFEFGQIAAANALSDIYAMGGKPITAMNVVCFPTESLPLSILKETLAGGMEKIKESGAVLVGGHSVEDKELKYGLSVTGVIHPQHIVLNQNAKPGDQLILTKPLGIGIIATAIKGNIADNKTIQTLIQITSTLNKTSSMIMMQHSPHACTDITGFGLAGHTLEMAKASNVEILLWADSLPYIDSSQSYAQMGLVPAGLYRNRDYYSPFIDIHPSVDPFYLDLLFDPQTSGGLLISMSKKNAKTCMRDLKKKGVDATIIGEVIQPHTSGKLMFKNA